MFFAQVIKSTLIIFIGGIYALYLNTYELLDHTIPSRTGTAKTFSLGFTINSDGLILCADGTVDFWTIQVSESYLLRMQRRSTDLVKSTEFVCEHYSRSAKSR